MIGKKATTPVTSSVRKPGKADGPPLRPSSLNRATPTHGVAPNRNNAPVSKPIPPPASKPPAGMPTGARKKVQPVEEEKKEAPKTGLFTEKPSAKLTGIKTADPFAAKSSIKTNSFAYVYNAGGIPCRIDHGSISNKLRWDQNVILSELPFDPILVTCFEGLLEDKHPYNFIAREAIRQLLESDDAAEKVIPLIPRIVAPLRNAFASTNDTIFDNGLKALKYSLRLSEIGPIGNYQSVSETH
eukprot:TRINITY_DN2140_c0_g3_i4.p1 TRINITY_DN2140_c0_g3~~TRINITY_DN2140_c0_g3_i4.p1  ORF type:complete len:242 (-),score=21.89 TRINITY_DN2140_c0_g3_i4:262-987(-)